MEVKHRQRVGGTLRDAETENAYWLARSEAIARESKAPAAPPTAGVKKRLTREERLAQRPVTRTIAKGPGRTWKNTSPCGRCGTCRRCKAEKRVYAIAVAAKRDGNKTYSAAIHSLWLLSLAVEGRTGQYATMTKRDANRILTRRMEDLCDSTVMQMGPWL